MSRTILVTGATGRQGGGVVRALAGTDFEILALSRNASSPSAQKLAASSPNIKIVQGDLDDAPAVFAKAREVTKNPIWGVYSVQAKPVGDLSQEEVQGKALIDASIDANVQFFVYSSVDRGDTGISSEPTTVPHWATKYRVEKYLEEKAPGKMQYTVLRPAAFMENLTNDFQGKAMASMWLTSLKQKHLQLIATKDIGWFAALAFKNSEMYAGLYISLAGADLSVDEANAIFQKTLGMNMPATYGFVAHAVLHFVKDLGAMFKWLKHHPGGADVDELRNIHPGMLDLGTWLKEESQFKST